MAGAVFINAIGVLSGAFGIIQFSQSNFAGAKPEGATITIKGTTV
jgi:hypothetical protein